MYKRVLLYSIIFILGIILGTDVTANFSHPNGESTAKHSKQTLILNEVLQIEDQTDKFYFKHPDNLKVSDDGCIFVKDKEQLLKFDSKGNFAANFFKKGQGPREMISISNYFIQGDVLVIHDSHLAKMLYINHRTGAIQDEFRIPGQAYLQFWAISDGMLYFLKTEPRDTKGMLKIMDVDVNLLMISTESKKVQQMNSFPISYMVLKAGESRSVQPRSRLLSTPVDGGEIFISHNPQYEIKLFNFRKNKVVRRISREFERTEVTEETRKFAPGGNMGKISIDGVQFFKVPVDKYLPDIQQLLRYKDTLWAVTSAVSEGNKVLVHVYARNGDYAGQLYIKCPPKVKPHRVRNWIKAVSSDFLYAVEEDEDGQRLVKKYRIGFTNDK